MKNIENIYVRLTDTVYAKFELSTKPMAKQEFEDYTIQVINPKGDEYKELYASGQIFNPARGGHPVDNPDKRGMKKEQMPSYNENGTLTEVGALRIVDSFVEYLDETASMVWGDVDPNCGPKVASRMYKRMAYICADALHLLGFQTKVVKQELNPAECRGLKHQYRVSVSIRIPDYPWHFNVSQIDGDPRKTRRELVSKWKNLEFDFNPAYQRLSKWAWADIPCVRGYDVRILRDGHPRSWTPNFRDIVSTEDLKIALPMNAGVDKKVMLGVLMKHTCMMTTEGFQVWWNEKNPEEQEAPATV